MLREVEGLHKRPEGNRTSRDTHVKSLSCPARGWPTGATSEVATKRQDGLLSHRRRSNHAHTCLPVEKELYWYDVTLRKRSSHLLFEVRRCPLSWMAHLRFVGARRYCNAAGSATFAQSSPCFIVSAVRKRGSSKGFQRIVKALCLSARLWLAGLWQGLLCNCDGGV